MPERFGNKPNNLYAAFERGDGAPVHNNGQIVESLQAKGYTTKDHLSAQGNPYRQLWFDIIEVTAETSQTRSPREARSTEKIRLAYYAIAGSRIEKDMKPLFSQSTEIYRQVQEAQNFADTGYLQLSDTEMNEVTELCSLVDIQLAEEVVNSKLIPLHALRQRAVDTFDAHHTLSGTFFDFTAAIPDQPE